MPSSLVAHSRYAARERHARHAHGYANLSVILAGSLVERVGRVEETVGPLSVVIKPADTEHANVFGAEGARLLRVRIPPQLLEAQEDGVRAVDRWRWVNNAPVVRWLLRLAAAERTDASLDDGIAECLGAIDADLPRDAASTPDWLLRVRERVRDERGRGTRVAALAHDADVHPVYLTRRFRAAFGCSVMACIQAERVRAAADALAASTTPISQVAYDAGFSDQSHLTRAFGRFAGLTPAAYRSLAAGPVEG
jgi:AraC family transcriptional regulator